MDFSGRIGQNALIDPYFGPILAVFALTHHFKVHRASGFCTSFAARPTRPAGFFNFAAPSPVGFVFTC
jgi:hypothetical protein